ncbi:hypothetical protein U1Q18_048421 [Sarracenia purpurea var. burkii]
MTTAPTTDTAAYPTSVDLTIADHRHGASSLQPWQSSVILTTIGASNNRGFMIHCYSRLMIGIIDKILEQ